MFRQQKANKKKMNAHVSVCVSKKIHKDILKQI